jgi:hypothetical protein
MTLSPPVDPIDVGDEEEFGAGVSPRRRSARLRAWTRKLHNYLGLYLLLFLWFFSVSGLVLNHSKWSVARFWDARQESTTERAIRSPAATEDVAMAAELRRQLAIVGEIGETKRHADGARFEFQVVKPGRVYRVEARLDSARARVTEIRLNVWGVFDALHKFTGVRMDEPARTRDWAMTWIWSLAMDALAIGLVVLVLSGLHLWYGLSARRRPGLIALAAGLACCAFFLYGLGVLLA